MRTHKLHCLVKNELFQFPRSDGNHRKCIHKTTSIGLFCNCRMPWAKSTECASAYLENLLMRNTLNGIVISVYY